MRPSEGCVSGSNPDGGTVTITPRSTTVVDLTDEDLEDRIYETVGGDLVLGDLEIKLTEKQMTQLRDYLAGRPTGV